MTAKADRLAAAMSTSLAHETVKSTSGPSQRCSAVSDQVWPTMSLSAAAPSWTATPESPGVLVKTSSAAPCLLLDLFTDDTLLRIAEAVESAADLLRLGLSCCRFADKVIAVVRTSLAQEASGVSGGGGGAAAAEMLSIVDEAARRWRAGRSDAERAWAPRREGETWLGLKHEVEVLGSWPLIFSQAHASLLPAEGGAVVTMQAADNGDSNDSSDPAESTPQEGQPRLRTFRTATTGAVMRAGRHFSEFTVLSGEAIFFGVTPAGWDAVEEVGAVWLDGHCFFFTHTGNRWPNDREWEGQKSARTAGDRIGLLLDLDQGSLTVYKNSVRLGEMVQGGLGGEYCWAVSLGEETNSARIGRGAYT